MYKITRTKIRSLSYSIFQELVLLIDFLPENRIAHKRSHGIESVYVCSVSTVCKLNADSEDGNNFIFM